MCKDFLLKQSPFHFLILEWKTVYTNIHKKAWILFSMLCISLKTMFGLSLLRCVVKVIRVFSIWNLFLVASISVQQDFHMRLWVCHDGYHKWNKNFVTSCVHLQYFVKLALLNSLFSVFCLLFIICLFAPFFFLSSCCLSFLDLRFLTTSFVSTNFPRKVLSGHVIREFTILITLFYSRFLLYLVLLWSFVLFVYLSTFLVSSIDNIFQIWLVVFFPCHNHQHLRNIYTIPPDIICDWNVWPRHDSLQSRFLINLAPPAKWERLVR